MTTAHGSPRPRASRSARSTMRPTWPTRRVRRIRRSGKPGLRSRRPLRNPTPIESKGPLSLPLLKEPRTPGLKQTRRFNQGRIRVMPPALWSLMPLFTVVAGLACLVVAVTLWVLAARKMKTTRSETEQRLQMLTQRLLVIESRINELENHGRRAHITPARKKRIVGQAFQPDSEPCQAGKPDLLPCRRNNDHQYPPGHSAPGESKQGRRTQSFLDVRVDQNARNEPTLIAVPDLGAVEEEPEGRAGSELGERHGEAWTLAAAGVPSEEIARQTGQPIGQIELIVGLYRRLHSSRGSIDHARSR